MEIQLKVVLLLLMVISLASGCHQTRLRAASSTEIEKIQGSIYFDFNRWTLRPDQQEVLSRKAGFLRKYTDTVVVLEGRTDAAGSEEYNLELGDRRARKVKSELTQEGVEPGRVVVVSFGERDAQGRGRSSECREDRRVDIRVK